jgi:hypothetical protein
MVLRQIEVSQQLDREGAFIILNSAFYIVETPFST